MLHALPTLSLPTLEDHMVSIEGGEFMLGEEVQVTLDSFQLCRFPVSQQLWREVMGSDPERLAFQGLHRPVERVHWYDAVSFCNALSQRLDLMPYYHIDPNTPDPNNRSNFDDLKWTVLPNPQANGFRLPTEAEWEYAAREGQASRGYAFSGSQRLEEVGFFSDNSFSETIPAGYHRPNALGLYDLSGNVWEWVWDWYASLPDQPTPNPTGPASGGLRVHRGGSWYYSADSARGSSRGYWHPDFRDYGLGFRLARS